jgi:hypothetical protein
MVNQYWVFVVCQHAAAFFNLGYECWLHNELFSADYGDSELNENSTNVFEISLAFTKFKRKDIFLNILTV